MEGRRWDHVQSEEGANLPGMSAQIYAHVPLPCDEYNQDALQAGAHGILKANTVVKELRIHSRLLLSLVV